MGKKIKRSKKLKAENTQGFTGGFTSFSKKYKKRVISIIISSKNKLKKLFIKLSKQTVKAIYKSYKRLRKIVLSFLYPYTKKTFKFAHHHVAKRPHAHLMQKSKYYAAWHSWEKKYLKRKQLSHKQIHQATLGVYVVGLLAFVLSQFGFIFAADISTTWDFSNASDYTHDAAIEIQNDTAKLKGQSYMTDSNTSALYHFDENSGSNIFDSSANANNGTTGGSPSFISSVLSNGLSSLSIDQHYYFQSHR